MAVNIGNAVAAYTNAAGKGLDSGLKPRSSDPAKGFGAMVEDAAKAAVEVGQASEDTAARAIAGNADINEVVTAVSNAEVTLQTVLAVRDRVIQAYQDIIRMPI